MWPKLSVTEFDLVDVVCYDRNLTFCQVKKMMPTWMLPNLSVAEFDSPDMV